MKQKDKQPKENLGKSIYNIPGNLNRNLNMARFVVFSCLLAVILLFAILLFYETDNIKNSNLKYILIDKQGNTYKNLSYLSDKEAYRIEAKAQIIYFITLFYQFSRENINYNLDKARLIGDKSVNDIFYKNQTDKFYARLMDMRGSTYVNPLGLAQNIRINDNVTEFKATFEMLIVADTEKKRLSFNVTIIGKLRPTARNDNNAHGILLTELRQIISQPEQ